MPSLNSFRFRKFRDKGFILPLSLIIMLIVLIMALWSSKQVLYDLWSTVAQKQSTSQFYAAEAGARWALVYYLYTTAVDNLNNTNSTINTSIVIPTSQGNVDVDLEIKFLGISRDCDFKAVCCRRFEIKSRVHDGGPLVKMIGIKAIPNPELDEEAKKVCVM